MVLSFTSVASLLVRLTIRVCFEGETTVLCGKGHMQAAH